MSRTVKLTVEYDGSDLCGWQRQDNGPTVQAHLEAALAQMIGPTAVVGASRTDAGVHATGQVASFTTATAIPPYGFLRGINGALPASVAVVAAEDAPAGFHARFWARGKHYRYTVLTRATRSPLLAGKVWHRPGLLDLTAMRAAAAALVGEHDFSAFRATGCAAAHPVRTIHGIDIHHGPGDTVEIDVRGNAFLRNMVRIISGTLVEVGAGRIPADELAAIVASRDRTRAGITAPAGGLCLCAVFYPDAGPGPGQPGDEAL